MLVRSAPLPTGPGWRYEPKLDGYRALVCTDRNRLSVHSRRGWDMTARVPELAQARPANVQLDGELIAWGDDATPDFTDSAGGHGDPDQHVGEKERGKRGRARNRRAAGDRKGAADGDEP
jgi:hypothetical protein